VFLSLLVRLEIPLEVVLGSALYTDDAAGEIEERMIDC